MNKAQLMKKYGIKSIGGGEWGKGFVSCLKSFDEKNGFILQKLNTKKPPNTD